MTNVDSAVKAFVHSILTRTDLSAAQKASIIAQYRLELFGV